jgi:uncharacterized protein YndB with AHSA1/START domain
MASSVAPNNQDVGSVRIRQEIVVKALPNKVFHALTKDVSYWWGAPYLLSEAPQRLVIEPRLGGLFYEDWGAGNGAVWGTVSKWDNGRIFEFTGRCGMSGAVYGVIGFELQANGDATLLKLEHDVIGHVSPETEAMYAGGWKDLLGRRLKAYLEEDQCHGVLKK